MLAGHKSQRNCFNLSWQFLWNAAAKKCPPPQNVLFEGEEGRWQCRLPSKHWIQFGLRRSPAHSFGNFQKFLVGLCRLLYLLGCNLQFSPCRRGNGKSREGNRWELGHYQNCGGGLVGRGFWELTNQRRLPNDIKGSSAP